MPLFETQVSLPCSSETLFNFLIRPVNVVELNRPEMKFALIEAPDVIQEGSQIRFQVEALGFKQQMLHEVSDFHPMEGFVVREVEGVLKKFEHHHRLEAQPDGSTILFEKVDYEPPGGVVGFIVTEAKVREGMEKNFLYRHNGLKQQFAGS